ncbi:hypothetical protein LIER_06754 [Lithospermum erythrorhizon]|uniref:Uncharacterized protein n=1 Tax=Lithospermum erythrorhizon TaxID=34254 RepID=A0AAV3P6E7_LITER
MDGAITSWAWSGGSPTSMLQQANEELEILEAQYPNRFEYLKIELKSFISLIESQNKNDYNMGFYVNPTSSSTTTQASTTEKRRKNGCHDLQKVRRVDSNIEAKVEKYEKVECEGQVTKKKRIDAVMEKAQACLNKIQLFKTSF